MNQNILWKLQYKKNPKTVIIFSTNILLFTSLYLLGTLSTVFISHDLVGWLTLTTIFIFIITLILYWYLPLFKSITLYKKLNLYKDKLIINGEKEYPIDKISCQINSIHKGHRLISASWSSCIFSDDEDNIVGEFVFTIDTKDNILDITPQSLLEVINDLKQKKDYDFTTKLQKDYERFLNEKQTYNKAMIILILVFIVPALIGLLFSLL
jgi:hypothetical protein